MAGHRHRDDETIHAPPPLVLASASPRRRQLLASAGFRFEARVADVDESRRPDEDVLAYVQRAALAKADAVARQLRAAGDRRVVLGADTIVILAGEQLGKPRDRDDAQRMLRSLSGRTHQVTTAFCLLGPADADQLLRKVTTDVTFKRLSDREINRYLDVAEWQDKAGAYAIQAEAAYIVRAIRGSYTNVVGLPLCETVEALAGLQILGRIAAEAPR